MPYEITVNTESGYINLQYSGVIKLQDRKRARDEVIELCHRYGIARSLVETQDSDIRMSESDVVHFAVGFENVDLPPNYRLACVVAPGGDGDKLLEIIITTEGINVKYFLQREDARQWLLAT